MNLADELRRTGQPELAHLLETLPDDEAATLAAEVAAVDLDLIAGLVDSLVRVERPELMGEVSPADPSDFVRIAQTDEDRERDRAARVLGERMLRDGRVAAVLLAGGQGSRLGFDGPKGAFPFAPITGRPLFWHHSATIAALRERHRAPLPLYILTSPANDAETRDFFAANDHFGLEPASVHFVVQGTLPAVDATTGALLREAPGHLALSPDGHGGLLTALRRSGTLDQMAGAGIDTMFTFQVDNPLVRTCRPEFLGHHELAGAQMSSVVVRKVGPEERMGVIARVDGRPGVVEYSDLPDELANLRDDEGELVYWAGSIAVHCISREFAEQLTQDGVHLPHHRALKVVPYVDADGRTVEPAEPNAVKFETFLFDALAHADRTVAVEAAREEEFAPIKNATGSDSPETARRALNRLYATWIEAAGVEAPRDADGEPVDIEIDPRLALDADELAGVLMEGLTISGPTVLGPPT
jgi:UDP-N-acetylglucosamine/UDP-N-acetylgalactosamine diphosphorylase